MQCQTHCAAEIDPLTTSFLHLPMLDLHAESIHTPTTMINITPQQLRKAANIQEKIQSLQKELGQLLGGEIPTPASTEASTTKGRRKRRKMSAEGRANIRAAQLARRAMEGGEQPKKKQVSEAKLKALAKAREARWAKMRAAKRTQAKPAKASDKSAQEKPKQKRKMTAAWRRALERAWAARRAIGKAAKKAKV